MTQPIPLQLNLWLRRMDDFAPALLGRERRWNYNDYVPVGSVVKVVQIGELSVLIEGPDSRVHRLPTEWFTTDHFDVVRKDA